MRGLIRTIRACYLSKLYPLFLVFPHHPGFTVRNFTFSEKQINNNHIKVYQVAQYTIALYTIALHYSALVNFRVLIG